MAVRGRMALMSVAALMATWACGSGAASAHVDASPSISPQISAAPAGESPVPTAAPNSPGATPQAANHPGSPRPTASAPGPASPVATSPAASPKAQANCANPCAVKIQNFAFSPAAITIKVGTTATWTNLDTTVHTVTSSDGSFDSKSMYPPNGDMPPQASFSFTFSAPGSHSYICSVHTYMHGSVTVVS